MLEYAKDPAAIEELALEKKAHARTRYLLDSRNQILELMATGVDLTTVLHKLIKTVEAYVPEIRGSIFLVDGNRKRLRMGAAPSLPDYFNRAVDRTPIKMGLGCCGTAAFTGKRTIAEKIAVHPYWVAVKDLAAKAQLHACWSEPIYSSDGKVMGTFAFYLAEPRGPNQEEIELISQSADIAGIAIEQDRAEKTTRVNMGLQQVRIEILHMENEQDWLKIAHCVQRELREVLRFNESAIILVDPAAGQYTSYHIHKEKMRAQVFDAIPASLQQVIETGAPLYRKNRREIVAHDDRVDPEIMSVVDVPFQGGTVAINALEEYAFETEEIAVLEQFAQVLSEAHRRLEDLQALKKKETQLRQAQKMEAIGQFTTGIAHNFNNRLMVILNSFEYVQLMGEFDLDVLQRGEKAALRAGEMIKQLMLFSRAENSLEFQPVQIKKILQDAMETGLQAFDKKVIFIDEMAEDPPLVAGDENQLEQAFQNLLHNARDALETSQQSAPSIEVEINKVSYKQEQLVHRPEVAPGEYICIRLTDNGVGMDAETRAHIFEPFFTTKEVGKGTGLGLATVYGIVTEHEGWIKCDSQLGVGTSFSVYLPVAKREELPLEPESSNGLPRGTETILIVEDEEDILGTMVPQMSNCGYRVLVSRNGEEGWQIFQRERENIDLVILDLSMPKMTGQELLSHMLSLNPATKVIISTGNPDHSAETLGTQALLIKPYGMVRALQVIREVLDNAVGAKPA